MEKVFSIFDENKKKRISIYANDKKGFWQFPCPHCSNPVKLITHTLQRISTCERCDWKGQLIELKGEDKKNPVLESALEYLGMGYSVIPVNESKDELKGKKPYIQWTEYQSRKATIEEVRKWWERWPNAMIGIVTGKVSGLAVFDTDTQEAKSQFEAYLPENFVCPMTTTPKGGNHYIMLYVEGIRNTNAATDSKLKFHVRGEGGYFIAPPSKRNGGGQYQWADGLSLGSIRLPAPPNPLLKDVTQNTEEGPKGKPPGWEKECLNVSQGDRNNALTQLAGRYVEKGLSREEALSALMGINEGYDPPLPQKEVETILDSILRTDKRKHGERQEAEEKPQERSKGRNLTEELRTWLSAAYGSFTNEQIYKELVVISKHEKHQIRVELSREADKGTIERGRSTGNWIKIDKTLNRITILKSVPTPIPIKWPGEVEKLVKIYPGSLVVVAGATQQGKSAYLLNTAFENKHLFTETYYHSSEMWGPELTERLMKFNYPMDEWDKIIFNKRTFDFEQIIEPDSFNLIDYLEAPESEFYKIAGCLTKIYQQLKNGLAIVALQMDKGKEYARGGEMTKEKARLYLVLKDDTLKIEKGKSWANVINPDGMTRTFKLVEGCKFKSWGEWEAKPLIPTPTHKK